MIEQIKNPPKGFENVIKRHFYLKKKEIMEEVNLWLKYASEREANYTGLIVDHNHSYANMFKGKDSYKQQLEKVIKELEEVLNSLPPPSEISKEIKSKHKRQ